MVRPCTAWKAIRAPVRMVLFTPGAHWLVSADG